LGIGDWGLEIPALRGAMSRIVGDLTVRSAGKGEGRKSWDSEN